MSSSFRTFTKWAELIDAADDFMADCNRPPREEETDAR